LPCLPPAGKLNGRNPLKAIALASSAVSALACTVLTLDPSFGGIIELRSSANCYPASQRIYFAFAC
ncbi:MAG: hypothetical protein ACTS44_01920, partial [Candidatus Hodgkinia cicadicola]